MAVAGGDAVNAQAQDGSGTNNATFATPADGTTPTMRMFIWNSNASTGELFSSEHSPSGIAGKYTSSVSTFAGLIKFHSSYCKTWLKPFH